MTPQLSSIDGSIIVLLSAILLITVFWRVRSRQNRYETERYIKRVLQASDTRGSPPVDFASLSTLPEPVKNYFHYVFSDGQRVISLARFEQSGKLKINPKSKKWSHFESLYYVSERPPGFVWDARVEISPLLHIRIRDSLIEGVGAGKATLMSAITIGTDENHTALNTGALYRYLAEAVWHPTALLPQLGIRWEAVDEKCAVAHLSTSGISVSLEFRFNERSEIIGIYTKERFGKFGNTYIKYPWEGFFGNYREFDGIKIPTEGSVGWHLPSGWWLFWKGNILKAEFTYC